MANQDDLRAKLREVVGDIYNEGHHCGFTKEESYQVAVDDILKAIDKAGFNVVKKSNFSSSLGSLIDQCRNDFLNREPLKVGLFEGWQVTGFRTSFEVGVLKHELSLQTRGCEGVAVIKCLLGSDSR